VLVAPAIYSAFAAIFMYQFAHGAIGQFFHSLGPLRPKQHALGRNACAGRKSISGWAGLPLMSPCLMQRLIWPFAGPGPRVITGTGQDSSLR